MFDPPESPIEALTLLRKFAESDEFRVGRGAFTQKAHGGTYYCMLGAEGELRRGARSTTWRVWREANEALREAAESDPQFVPNKDMSTIVDYNDNVVAPRGTRQSARKERFVGWINRAIDYLMEDES